MAEPLARAPPLLPVGSDVIAFVIAVAVACIHVEQASMVRCSGCRITLSVRVFVVVGVGAVALTCHCRSSCVVGKCDHVVVVAVGLEDATEDIGKDPGVRVVVFL